MTRTFPPTTSILCPAHTLLFFSFDSGGNLCMSLFLFFSSSSSSSSLVFSQGPHFRMMFFSLRFSLLLLLSLILMRTGRVDDTSTRWKYTYYRITPEVRGVPAEGSPFSVKGSSPANTRYTVEIRGGVPSTGRLKSNTGIGASSFVAVQRVTLLFTHSVCNPSFTILRLY